MCVRVRAHACVCVCVQAHVCMGARVCVRKHTRQPALACVRARTRAHTHTMLCMHERLHMLMRVPVTEGDDKETHDASDGK